MENQRIKAIYDAAAGLFLRQGYSKTQISHIAKAVGVSVGTIYHDFVGKQEIMHFVLKCTIDPSFIERDLERPIGDALFYGLKDEIVTAFETNAEEFSRHLGNRAEGYSFESLISDAFDLLWKYAVGCLFIEKNQFDFPDLAVHYKKFRKRFFTAMADYLTIFMEKGTVRPLKYPDLTVHVIIEMLSWWAMDMRYISFDNPQIPMELAKEACMDNLLSAYQA